MGTTAKVIFCKLHNSLLFATDELEVPLLKLEKWYARLSGTINFGKVAWVRTMKE